LLYALLLFLALLYTYFLIDCIRNNDWMQRRKRITDELTGLPHSKLFELQLHKHVIDKTPFYLILLKPDNLTALSTLGNVSHLNEPLRHISQRLIHWLPSSGYACRLKGDHFLVCITDSLYATLSGAYPECWHEMREWLSAPYLIEHKLRHITISMRITTFNGEDLTLDPILARLNPSLKCPLDDGFDPITPYNESQSEPLPYHTLLETGLRCSLQQNQLSLHYQPQFDLHTGMLKGFEALLRWNHPVLGSISPNELIPIAEETHLIVPIGEWILRQACSTFQRIAPAPSMLTMSVNISSVQLQGDRFVELVTEILNETGMHAERLELEFTENSLMNAMDFVHVERTLTMLQAAGVRLALDNFRMSYPPTNNIHLLPFDLVKIDKSLIHNIGSDSEQETTRSIIQFLRQKPCCIIAEGLETYEQLHYLKQCQCDYAQGYLFSLPMSDEQLALLIQAG